MSKIHFQSSGPRADIDIFIDKVWRAKGIDATIPTLLTSINFDSKEDVVTVKRQDLNIYHGLKSYCKKKGYALEVIT